MWCCRDSRVRSLAVLAACLAATWAEPALGLDECGQSAAGDRYFWAAIAGESPRNNNCFGGSGFRCSQAIDGQPFVRLKNPACDPTTTPCVIELRVPIELPGVEQMVDEDGFGSPTPAVYWFAADEAPPCPGSTVDCGQEMICGLAGTTAGKIDADFVETWIERPGVTCDNAENQSGVYSLRVMVCRTACRIDTVANGISFDELNVAASIGGPKVRARGSTEPGFPSVHLHQEWRSDRLCRPDGSVSMGTGRSDLG